MRGGVHLEDGRRVEASHILAIQEVLVGGADVDADGEFDKSHEEKGPDTK